MAFWNRNNDDTGTENVKITRERYEELEKACEQLRRLQEEVKNGERLIILRSDYLRLQLDSEEAERLRGLEATYQYSTLNEMQAKLDLIEKQCEYWQKQATSAQSQLKEAAQNATKWHEAYDELNRNIDQQIEQGRLSAARQDALELKQLEEQLRKEADNKITEAAAMADQKIREAQKQLSIATQRQKNAAQRLQEAQAIEISYEARETALKAREQNVMEREQAISGKLASAQNVYRIMRERANAARGIVPKKSHDGYLVLSSRQWIERYPAVVSGKKMQCSTAVWKSVLETPYDVALVADQIGKQIENDLRTIVNDIGCHCMVSDKDNGRYKISMEKIENTISAAIGITRSNTRPLEEGCSPLSIKFCKPCSSARRCAAVMGPKSPFFRMHSQNTITMLKIAYKFMGIARKNACMPVIVPSVG